MKVTVIGPGALGCMFAARFAAAGIDTTLIDHRPERAQVLKKNGIRVLDGDREVHASPRLATAIPPKCDLALLLTKSTATSRAALSPRTPTLTLQNGLGNAEAVAARVGAAFTLAGATSEACTLLETGVVRHAARGRSVFGPWTTCDAKPALELFGRAELNAELTTAPGQTIWEKAVISAAINPVTALLNITNGRVLEIPEARQLLRSLVVEAAKVAAMEGYRFPHSLVEHAEDVCRETSENISSMLQDFRNERPTEIESIAGEILQRAEAASLPTPRTRVVYQLIKGIEKR